jgi:hypothetical protein
LRALNWSINELNILKELIIMLMVMELSFIGQLRDRYTSDRQRSYLMRLLSW